MYFCVLLHFLQCIFVILNNFYIIYQHSHKNGTPQIELGTPQTELGTPQTDLGTGQIEMGTGEISISPVPISFSPVPNFNVLPES